MTPVFSNAKVSTHTYKFWTTSMAKYNSINNIDKNKNTHDIKPTQNTK